jgi:hypothetical protein
MEKIAFTLYVFGIMIMFPLYVFLELNHGSDTILNVEKISIPANENVISRDDTFSANNILLFMIKF